MISSFLKIKLKSSNLVFNHYMSTTIFVFPPFFLLIPQKDLKLLQSVPKIPQFIILLILHLLEIKIEQICISHINKSFPF